MAAPWRLFQEVTDLSTGAQGGVNALQKKWPNEVTNNSISRSASPSPWGCPVSLVNGQALPAGGFCLWAFVSLNPGEFNGGDVRLLTALPARPWVSPTHWGLRAASFSQSLEVMKSLKRREAFTCKGIKNLRK